MPIETSPSTAASQLAESTPASRLACSASAPSPSTATAVARSGGCRRQTRQAQVNPARHRLKIELPDLLNRLGDRLEASDVQPADQLGQQERVSSGGRPTAAQESRIERLLAECIPYEDLHRAERQRRRSHHLHARAGDPLRGPTSCGAADPRASAPPRSRSAPVRAARCHPGPRWRRRLRRLRPSLVLGPPLAPLGVGGQVGRAARVAPPGTPGPRPSGQSVSRAVGGGVLRGPARRG